MTRNKSLTSDQLMTMLDPAPRRIAEMTSGLTDIQLQTAPADGEWSINEVLAHLRSCADVWGQSIATILEQDKPTIRAVNPRTWIKSTDYTGLDFRRSLKAYTAQRTDLMTRLRKLDRKAWSRSAHVTGAGKPLDLTVWSYVERLAVHERPHLKQIEQIVDTMRENG